MKQLTPRQINAQRRRDGKPPLNFRLLRMIIKKIEANPEAYEQSVWGERADDAPCGTAACIAGWACFLDGKMDHKQLRRNQMGTAAKAAASLGLHVDLWVFRDEKDALFNGDPSEAWPEPYATRWLNAGDSKKRRARIAVAFLKHIINTGQIVSN